MVGKTAGRVGTMSKVAKALTAIQVSRLNVPGFHAVGTVSGLYLSVGSIGTSQRSWILRLSIGGKRREAGLGSFPEVTLAQAHEKARALKEQARQGIDPVAERKAKRAAVVWTFDKCAEEFIALHRSEWKSAKHAEQWVNTLATYASPRIGGKHVAQISRGDVLSVIEPHWLTKNETMVRVRNRIELVLGWAAVHGHREGANPAQWRGNLDHALPKPSRVNQRQHHKALPYQSIASFWERLQSTEGFSARALQWVVLTACRSGEARGMVWCEVDVDRGVWTIPASRMKAGKEHRVPLSDAAVKLLAGLVRFEPPVGNPDYVFPGRTGGLLSDMSLAQTMRRMQLDAVPHGLRSTFVDWAADCTSYPVELREAALAHTLGNATREAYQRGDLLERRRQMMQDWASFVVTGFSGNVFPIRAAA